MIQARGIILLPVCVSGFSRQRPQGEGCRVLNVHTQPRTRCREENVAMSHCANRAARAPQRATTSLRPVLSMQAFTRRPLERCRVVRNAAGR